MVSGNCRGKKIYINKLVVKSRHGIVKKKKNGNLIVMDVGQII